MKKIIIRYEIGEKAAREEFIKNGVYYEPANYGRWLEINVDLSALSTDERKIIWDYCVAEGDGTFRFDSHYIGKAHDNPQELIKEIKNKIGAH